MGVRRLGASICRALKACVHGSKPVVLPPQGKQRRKKTLVLDLDCTLVYCKVTVLSNDDDSAKADEVRPLPGFDSVLLLQLPAEEDLPREVKLLDDETSGRVRRPRFCAVHMKQRPGAQRLLLELYEVYELVVFSAGSKKYVDAVMEFLDPSGRLVPPSHRLSHDHCRWFDDGGSSGSSSSSRNKKKHRKDLNVLGRDLRNVIVVDDNPAAFSSLHRRNLIRVAPFKGSKRERGEPEPEPEPDSAPSLPPVAQPRKTDVLIRLCSFLKEVAPLSGDVRKRIDVFKQQQLLLQSSHH